LKASNANQPRFPWDHDVVPGTSYWRTGLVIALLLLAGQIVYFEGAALSHNPAFRPGLEKLCRPLECRLAAYKNVDEFEVLQSSLSALPDHSQLFRVIISNTAAFAQPYPNLKLTLLDYAGNPFSRRIFRPQNYLPVALVTPPAMLSDANTAISLNIATLETRVGGYTFELIY
jgi:hypothetical protein